MSATHDEIRDRGTFWSRVDAALDARRDPLADEGVAAWLGAHPDLAAELAVLLARLDTLPARAPEPAARARRALRRAVVVAAAVLAVCAAWAALRPAPAPHTTTARNADATVDPRAFRIDHCTIEVVTRTPEFVRTTRVTDGVTESSVATTTRGTGPALASVVTRTRRTSTQESYP